MDLFVGYDEDLSQPQAALSRGTCAETVDCEYTRAKEGVRAWHETASEGSDAEAPALNEWLAAYDATLGVIGAFCGRFGTLCQSQPPTPTDPEQLGRDVCRWLIDDLEEQPLECFPDVRRAIIELSGSELASQKRIVEALFWIVQDRRCAISLCECHTCRTGTGVPVARVRLREWMDKDRRRCEVAFIDDHPPFRRELRRDCWPAGAGEVNLARALWRRPDEACTMLGDLGVRVAGVEELQLPDRVNGLRAALDCRPFASCGGQVTLQTWPSPLDGPRVVGFCGARDDGDASAPQRRSRTRRTAAKAKGEA